MSTITPHYRTVQQLLQSRSFSIDEYQREYKWEKKHIEELLHDLQNAFFANYRDDHVTKDVSAYTEYFLGSIIVSNRSGKSYLIDGQQRVTSLTLLLIYLYRAASDQALPVIQTIAPLIYSDNLGDRKFNLDIAERLPVLDALFKGETFTPDGRDESIRTMFERYSDFHEMELSSELGKALPHFIYWLMTRVGLIEISTDSDNYAYAIFETMNDRGKPLSPVDMLKAYLLAPIEDSERRREANTIWRRQVLELMSSGSSREIDRDANCIKAWLRAQYAETIRERKAGATDKDWELIGTVFHRWVRDNHSRLEIANERSNLRMIGDEFPFFARAYQKIIAASESYKAGWEAVFFNAHNDFTWQNTVLLAPLTVADDEETVRKKIAVTASYLDIWLMRRVVNYVRVGYSNASYAMFLLCRDIRRKPLHELVEILQRRLAEDDVGFEGSAAKKREGLNGLALNQFSRRYIYHLLARVTAYVEAKSGRADPFESLVDRTSDNPFDIEHIIPDDFETVAHHFDDQQDFVRWRDHVGSLLLLPADVNRSLQDKQFAQKKATYARQNFYAASLTEDAYRHQPKFEQFRTGKSLPFEPLTEFGKDQQLARRRLLDALASEIWSPDRLREAAE